MSQNQLTPAWSLGGATLYQGDAIGLMAAMPPSSVDCIWTDPPYNLSNGGSTCVSGRRAKVDKGAWDRSNGVESDFRFHERWLRECRRVLRPGGTIWVTGTVHVYPAVGLAMQTLNFRILNDIVWQKPAPPPNLGCRCFTHSTEILLWAAKRGRTSDRHTFNYDEMRNENGGKQMKNVWTFSPPGKSEKQHGGHPTQKPIALISRCLRASTRPGDLILDPFMGSGTTGVAALQLGRRFHGCESETDYLKLASARLADLCELAS